ncbi:helix-turn-helix domain-containing protein [Sulfitobacter pontiacus]|uniref:helix-turn-helix domain-containing protein n=1 Tax=Sulfitobacter pontiacus TaxID=60137 RepID=UPI003462466C
MSYKLVRKTRLKTLNSSTIKNVFLYLAEVANDDGKNIWPPISKIAGATGFSPSTVDVAMGKLKQSGLISKVGRKTLSSGRVSNLYEIDIAKLDDLPDAYTATNSELQETRYTKSCPHRPSDACLWDEVHSLDTQLQGASTPYSRVQYSKGISNNNTKSDVVRRIKTAGDIAQKDFERAIAAYNSVAKLHGWLNYPSQSSAVNAMLLERLVAIDGLEGWLNALKRAANSDYLCGRLPGKKFTNNAKYLLKNLDKLQQGGFDNADSRMRSVPAFATADKHHILMGRILREIAFDHRVEYWKLRSPKFAPQYPKAIQAARDAMKQAGIPENIISKFFGEVMA